MPKPKGSPGPTKQLTCETCGCTFTGHPRAKNCPAHRQAAHKARQSACDHAANQRERYLLQKHGPHAGRLEHLLRKATQPEALKAFALGGLVLTSPPDRLPVPPHRKIWHRTSDDFPTGNYSYWLIEKET